jgi:hypothetical protein
MTYADIFTTSGQFVRRVSVEKSHAIFREMNTFLSELYQRNNIRRVVITLCMNGRNSELVGTYTPAGWTVRNI